MHWRVEASYIWHKNSKGKRKPPECQTCMMSVRKADSSAGKNASSGRIRSQSLAADDAPNVWVTSVRSQLCSWTQTFIKGSHCEGRMCAAPHEYNRTWRIYKVFLQETTRSWQVGRPLRQPTCINPIVIGVKGKPTRCGVVLQHLWWKKWMDRVRFCPTPFLSKHHKLKKIRYLSFNEFLL